MNRAWKVLPRRRRFVFLKKIGKCEKKWISCRLVIDKVGFPIPHNYERGNEWKRATERLVNAKFQPGRWQIRETKMER